MATTRFPKMSVAELPTRQGELCEALATGAQVTLTGPTPDQTSAFLAYLNSAAGREVIARLSSPDLATKPLLQMDQKTTRHVMRALSDVGIAPASTPHAPPRRRQAAKADKEPQDKALPAASGPVTILVNGQPYRSPPLRVHPAPAAGHAAAAARLGPRETVVVGATGGMLLGAGAAHICNALRHVDPTGIGSILFAVAGAVAGAGAGTLLGAKLVKPSDVAAPALKIALATP